MAFDGITIASLVRELQSCLLEGRIFKIAQPEADELLLTIKCSNRTQKRLLISAGASLPLMYLTQSNKPSPITAPNFCMLLRKHIQNGKITKIFQPGLERIIHFEIEHYNEMGDLCHKQLIVELMGKHSNIIFCDDTGNIIDSIKHVSALVSSVREVLPGRTYFIPATIEKKNPLEVQEQDCMQVFFGDAKPVHKAIYTSMTGISPIVAQEICYRAGVDSSIPANALRDEQKNLLCQIFIEWMKRVKEGRFSPNMIMDGREPIDFAVFEMQVYKDKETKEYESTSAMLEEYYAMRDVVTRIRQKSADLRLVVQNALAKDYKKYDLQCKQLKDTKKREKYKLYGELLMTYGYGVEEGAKECIVPNYYEDNKEIKIPLDEDLSATENAKKYYEKYNKLKRTFEALTQIVQDTQSEIEHLESIRAAMDIALEENDLAQLKEELIEYGFIKRKGGAKKVKITSKPFHYISSDGYDMYVGKNNYQNEELTFKVASGNDWWFHAKGIPGSHVIVKNKGEGEMPDGTFEEAARLAAYYSKGKEQKKVEIDYIQKKHVKKVSGAKPGFVIYHTNYSMSIEPDIAGIEEVKNN